MFLGFDTSNYTTSAAAFNSATGEMHSFKRLLPVKEGELGLRQSDALFHHVQQLPEIAGSAINACGGNISAVCVSTRPRAVEGSYMPCFSAGVTVARAVAATAGVPVYECSHQQGHIAAALYSCGRTDLLESRFIAFHFSGGTSEAVLVEPDCDETLKCTMIAHSTDLKAGQAIDRVGAMLGLPFPAGPQLEQLAASTAPSGKIKISMNGTNPSISGLENKCKKMLTDGAEPATVARFAVDYVSAVVDCMTERLLLQYGDLPLVYAGGVMSNKIIARHIAGKYGGCFAEPKYSSDNAAGVALLAAIKHKG